jgi:hypothetical protein
VARYCDVLLLIGENKKNIKFVKNIWVVQILFVEGISGKKIIAKIFFCCFF